MATKPISPKKMKPISPDEVVASKVIPDEVIAAFNTLIAKEWNGRNANFKQDEVIVEVIKNFKASGKLVTRQQIFDEHYLDVEGLFEKAGWEVEYDKPAYCEDYDANFTFSKQDK